MLLSVFIVGTENKIYPKNIIILVIRLLEQNLQIYLILTRITRRAVDLIGRFIAHWQSEYA